MATTKSAISEHDVVVLREATEGWPAGTSGAVISTYDDSVLVEITGPGGKTFDTVQVPVAGLEIKSAWTVTRPSRTRRQGRRL